MATINHKKYDEATETFKDFYVYDGKETLIFKVDGEAGNVGIGTSAPFAPLDVNSGISSSSGTVLVLSQNTDGAIKGAASLGISVGNSGEATNAADLWFRTANGGSLSERMRITSAGNVGIGTTSPAAKLHLYGAYPELRLDGNSDVSGSGFLSFYRPTGGRDAYIQSGPNGLLIDAVSNTIFSNGASERMRITSAGLVGIGTSNPSYKLDVDVSTAGDWAARIKNTSSTGYGLFVEGSENSGQYILGLYNGLAYQMVVTGAGNVGIGTTSPFSKLDVATSSTEALFIGNTSTSIQAGDLLGAVSFGSRDSSTFSSGGITNIRSYATTTYNTSFVSGDLRFYTSNGLQNTTGATLFGTEVARFLADGGLTFNGDTAQANALDDYEEGTFTPTVGGSSSDPTVTYDTNYTSGKYTKIGNQVTVSFEVRWTALSGGSGSTRITGLPFTRFNGVPDGDRFILESYNNTISGLYLTGSVYRNSTYVDIVNNSSGTFTDLLVSQLSTGLGILRGTVTYFV